MAESKTVSMVPLNSSNYCTWKIQCKMALIKEGLWGIVNGTEAAPAEGAEAQAKFVARRDKALATIVLAMEPSLLYLVGNDPTDPVTVWRALSEQFQRRTWANKLELKRKLFSLRLAEGGSVQDHIKLMTEICDELSAIGERVSDEDRVVYLLASLPDSYSVLVTALEASTNVPTLAIVRERLLHEETKLKGKAVQEGALAASFKRKLRCHFCNKPGHFKKECEEYAKYKASGKSVQVKKKTKMGAFKVTITPDDEGSSDSESTGLVVQHAFSAGPDSHQRWILDSGATCHMCNEKSLFTHYQPLAKPLNVLLGDGRSLQAMGQGSIMLMMDLPDNKINKCTLHDVLLVPELAFNLFSVISASRKGKVTTFSETQCEIRDGNSKLVATGYRDGSLYYLKHSDFVHQACTSTDQKSKETIWHRRFGHLNNAGLRQLAKSKMVKGLDVECKQGLDFCECCVQGKSHQLPFQHSTTGRAERPLDLVHSDVCGRIGATSLGGGEYFVTFLDDCTRYVWVYIVKRKGEVLQKFREWKALVENSSGRKVKILRSDNGGEYTSNEFVKYLSQEGIKHELTIPHTPQQNGAAERLNRTLIEGVRTMLADSKLPHGFWAEALSTYVYLRNRSPTNALTGITPYEAWCGSKPDVSFFRIFGCSAYAHIPKTERRKLDPKSRKCVLLGYGASQKGYRLYDIERLKVIHSRDVVFDETSTPGVQKDTPVKYVQLQVNDEPTVESTEQQSLPGRESEIVTELNPSTQETLPTAPDEMGPRRSARSKHKPDRYGDVVTVALSDQDLADPMSVTEARAAVDRDEWNMAMEAEMRSLRLNKVWDLVEPPPNRKIIGSKWIFKRKFNADGVLERHKARLVAQGCTQKFGLDYEETYSPVVRFESIRVLLAMGAQYDLILHQMDVSTAFLNGELSEEVYMRQPEGFIEPGKENLVCQLRRSIYGLKQSPRCWNHALDSQLRDLGFSQTGSDPCLYVSSIQKEMFIVAVYVDDIILAGKTLTTVNAVKEKLSQRFKMKDLGSLHHFLGVKIIQDKLSKMIWIGQPMYIEKILQRFEMEDSKPVGSPLNPDVKLVASEDCKDPRNQQLYQAVVGSLLYVATKTRPDLACAVSFVARFCAKPSNEHWTAVKRILRYLNGTRELGLLYKGDTATDIEGYCDADWAGDVKDRKSMSGYVFLLGGAAVSWKSCKQNCVALSTAESEYIALCAASQEAVWLQQLMGDLLSKTVHKTIIFEDNQSAICLTKNQQTHGRSKHIDIKFHFIRELVESGKVELVYCASKDNVADMFTKGLNIKQFELLRQMTGLSNPLTGIEKEC